MHPRLLTTPLLTVHTFGLLLASAYFAAFWWLIREGRRGGLDVSALYSLGSWAIGGAIVGAKALMIVRDFPSVRGGAVRTLLDVGADERR